MAFIFLLGGKQKSFPIPERCPQRCPRARNAVPQHRCGNIGRVLPKYLSQWTSEKVKAQGVNVLPKANVEGAILEDYK